MITFAFFSLGVGEILLILGLVILLFGASRLPKLAKGLGQSIVEFRKAGKELSGESEELDKAKPKDLSL